MAASSAPRATDPRAASCSTASDAAAACRCWASSHVSKAAPPLTVMPSSRSAPSPGRPTAAVQLPLVAQRAPDLGQAPAQGPDRIVSLGEQQRGELAAGCRALTQDEVRQQPPALA